MSKTIITKSGSDFFTNIATEKLLGQLLHMCNAKHRVEQFLGEETYDMPYEMSEDEAKEASEKLLTLLNDTHAVFQKTHFYIGRNAQEKDLQRFIADYAKLLGDSKGYKCLF